MVKTLHFLAMSSPVSYHAIAEASYHYIFVSPVADCDILFLFMCHVSATHYLRPTHCVNMCMFLSCRLSRVYTLVMEVS